MTERRLLRSISKEIQDRRSRAGASQRVRRAISESGDPREVVADAHAPYFGLELDDRSLVPGDNPRVGATRFDEWLGEV
jgi:hypothetical protein